MRRLVVTLLAVVAFVGALAVLGAMVVSAGGNGGHSMASGGTSSPSLICDPRMYKGPSRPGSPDPVFCVDPSRPVPSPSTSIIPMHPTPHTPP